MRFLLFLFLQICIQICVQAQQVNQHQFLVYFNSKSSQFKLSQPEAFLSQKAIIRKTKLHSNIDETDLPVSDSLVNALQNLGYTVKGKSKWFNAVMIHANNKNQLQYLASLPYVKAVKYMGVFPKRSHTKADTFKPHYKPQPDKNKPYGKFEIPIGLLQINKIHEKNLLGQHVSVAVIDAGFYKTNQIPVMKHAMQQVVATYDFVDEKVDVFDSDEHGTSVFSCMAAADSGNIIGAAPWAKYYLLRSEDANYEWPAEEFYWCLAAEFADSAGVDIINTSVGYNVFDESELNHTIEEVKANQTLIATAAKLAVKKGIFVVVSAGNEGNSSWKHVVTPAATQEVLTVGGVNQEGEVLPFSSVGFLNNIPIKPNVSALANNVNVVNYEGKIAVSDGTSFASPVVAGGLACIWNELSEFTHEQKIELIQLASSHFFSPNVYTGYGMPNFNLLLQLAKSGNRNALLNWYWSDGVGLVMIGRTTDKRAIKLMVVNKKVKLKFGVKVKPLSAGFFSVVIPAKNLEQATEVMLTCKFKSGPLTYSIQLKK